MTRPALILAALLVSATAAAEPGTERPERPAHFGVGAGWFGSVSGPDHGPVFDAELWPGGAFGRLGARAELRGFRDLHRGLVAGGVTYEAAASRPRLQLALHAEAGATYPDARPAAGGGVATQLGLLGPLAIGIDSGAILLYDGVDTELLLSAALTLRLAH